MKSGNIVSIAVRNVEVITPATYRGLFEEVCAINSKDLLNAGGLLLESDVDRVWSRNRTNPLDG